MGRILLVVRLINRDLRRHPGQAALLLVVIAAATTILTLGLALTGVTSNPWNTTRAAAAGPDIVARTQNHGTPDDLATLTHAPGVAGATGPYPVTAADLRAGDLRVVVNVEGRDTRAAAIDQPYVTAGSWVRPGGAVVERGLAEALGVHPGETITLAGQSFRVAGIAVTGAWPSYPLETPGLIWVTQPDVRQLTQPGSTLFHTLNLRLTKPNAAPAFVAAHTTNDVSALSWQDIRDQDATLVGLVHLVVEVGSWLLGLLAVSSLAVLVGARMADQARRVGLLKAVGATPRLVAAILLAEYLAVALAAAAIGLATGWLAAPLLTSPGAGLVGAPNPPSVTPSTVAIVVAVAVGIAGAATLVPALRAARTSTIQALTNPSHPPRRRSRLIALSAHLPVPLLLGLRLAARRPRRTVLSAASLAITVAMIVVAITIQRNLSASNLQLGATEYLPHNAIAGRINQITLVLAAGLVILAAINAIFITWATIIDSRRPAALARAFGATPRQVSAGLSAAQLVPALAAALLGIPAGLGLFAAVITAVSTGSTPHRPATRMVLGCCDTGHPDRGRRPHRHPRPHRRAPTRGPGTTRGPEPVTARPSIGYCYNTRMLLHVTCR
jgi:putative ABC transport system permease protein